MKIEGFFRNLKDANNAVSKLKSEGYSNSFVDINEHLTNDIDPGTNNAGTENGFSLSRLTLKSGGEVIDDRTKAPLMAASPMASGMGGFEEIESVRCKVVVEADNNEEVEKIINKMGGELNNPNLNAHTHIKDIRLENVKLEDL